MASLSATENASSIEGTAIAFGAPKDVEYDLSRADVIVSLDCDFLGGESTLGAFAATGGTASARARTVAKRDTRMSRIYTADSQMSPDRRPVGSPAERARRRCGAVAIALAEAVLNHPNLRGQMRTAGRAFVRQLSRRVRRP